MGPQDVKEDIYSVMTNSRELTNYCQESVSLFQSKKISNSLNNFNSKNSIEFIKRSFTDYYNYSFDSNNFDFENQIELEDKPIYNKVIDYIDNYLFNLKC